MKNKFALIMSVFIIICCFSFSGCQNKSDDIFEYGSMVGDVYCIKNVKTKDITSVEIPSSYKGKPITSIYTDAFGGCVNLTKVVIPEGIETIEARAFQNCSKLSEVSLPNSLKKIGESAFYGCDSLHYTVYENGQYLGNSEKPCIALMKGIDNNVTSFNINNDCKIIYRFALSEFSKLKNIELPYSITDIGLNAFYLCTSLETFVVPNSVSDFDMAWFSYCTSLKSITLGVGIKTISTQYKLKCDSLSEFNVVSGNSNFDSREGVLYSKNLKTLLVYPDAKKGDNFSIPSYVESVSTHAFDGCIYLKSLTMFASVKELCSSAVINCDLLHTVHFKGTTNEWIALDNANSGWDHSFVINKVYCSNGVLNRGRA